MKGMNKSIVGRYREMAQEWVKANNQPGLPASKLRAALREWLVQQITAQDAYRVREQVAKQRKLKRPAKTLSDKLTLGREYILRYVDRQVMKCSCGRKGTVTCLGCGRWLCEDEYCVWSCYYCGGPFCWDCCIYEEEVDEDTGAVVGHIVCTQSREPGRLPCRGREDEVSAVKFSK